MSNKNKIGERPGSLIYTGNKGPEEPIAITHYYYDQSGTKKKIISAKELNKVEVDSSRVDWIDIEGIHSPELLSCIGLKFGLSPLMLEDILNVDHRPKIEVQKDYIFITLKKLTLIKGEKTCYKNEQISFVLFSNLLLSFQESETEIFKRVRERIENMEGRFKNRGEGYLVYSLLDVLVDNYSIVNETIEEELNTLEDRIINGKLTSDFQDIIALKKRVQELKKAILPLREFSFHLKVTEDYTGEKLAEFLEDLKDHLTVVIETVEGLNQRTNELVPLYQSTLSTATNETMKFLTMVSLIFIPISFLAGMYGMNFEKMPFVSGEHSFYYLVVLMALIVSVMVLFFKKKKWW